MENTLERSQSPLIKFLDRYWYYMAIVFMFMLGWIRPQIGLWMKSVGFTQFLVAIAFFLNGFALSTDSLVESAKEWKVLSGSLLITFGISPAVVFALRHVIPGGDTIIGEGFQLISIVPTLFVSAVVLTRIAKGNASTALCLTVSSNLLAIIIAPLLIKLTLGASGGGLDLHSTIISMIFTVLVPTIVGQCARKRWEVWASGHARLITIVSQSAILLFIVTGVSALPRSVLSPSVVTIAVVGGLILHAILFGIGTLGSATIGVNEADRRALTFCTAQKSFVFNVLLCERLFAGDSRSFGLAILPGIIYYLIVLTVDSVIAQWWQQRAVVMQTEAAQPRRAPILGRALSSDE